MPELWSESQIESFMRQGFDSGATLDQMKSYLVANGFVQGQQTVPAEPEVSSFRQRLEERVQAGEAAGGLRTVPAPGEEELPPAPEVGFEKLEAAALGTVLPYLQTRDIHEKFPFIQAAGPLATISVQGLSEGMRLAGEEPLAESPETRVIWEALRLAEEEVAPEGLLSSEGLQVLGLEILMDPMNALPGVGFADVPEKVFTAAGRRLLGKGLLGADEFAKAWSGGLTDEAWNETSRMMEAAQRSVVTRNLEQVHGEAGRAARNVFVQEEGADVLAVRTQKQIVEDAIQMTRERYADEIADTANEYFESLEQRDLFRRERQAEFGFVEADPRLAFDDLAQVPRRLGERTAETLVDQGPIKGTEQTFNVSGIAFDSKKGHGATGINSNIYYDGGVTWLTPEEFLKLSPEVANPLKGSMDFLGDAISKGEPIGPPMIFARKETNGSLRVTSHEGRHRSMVLRDMGKGDELIPVHLVLREAVGGGSTAEMKARHWELGDLTARLLPDKRAVGGRSVRLRGGYNEELGFVGEIPSSLARPPKKVRTALPGGAPLPELTISAREALRSKLATAFPKSTKKQIQEMLDESTKIGTQMAEDAVEPGPPLPGRTPEGLRKRLKEAFPDWDEEMVEQTVESAIEESQRVIQHSPGLEIPGRIGPPQTLYDTRDVLLKGLERQLADLNLMERVHTDLFNKEYDALINRLDTSPGSPLRERFSQKAEQIIERGLVSGDINRMAREAVERTYKVAIDRPTPPSRNMARLLARVGQKNFEEIAGRLSEAVPPAEMEKMGALDRLLWRAGYRFMGGESAEFIEGSLRAVAREYTDPGVKDLLTKTWPRLYTAHRGRVADRMFSAREASGRVSREIQRVARESGQSLDTIGRQLNKARTNGDLTEIADSGLRAVVRDATELIDNMSEEFISGGLIPDTEIEKFRENMGKYLHMNYATFSLANWKKNVKNTGIWENAFDWFKRQYPEMTDAEITGSMMYMLSNRKKIRVGKGAEPLINSLPGNLPKQVLDELKLKRDLPDELRELLGVNKDFLANFDITTGKMIHDLEVTRLHRQMLKTGLRQGVLRVSKDLTTPTEVKFDRIWNRPVYADEPLANALGVMDGMLNDKRNIVGILNGITKGMKIIPSPGTQMRNAISVPFMWMANGTWTAGFVGRTRDLARKAAGQELASDPVKVTRLMAKLWNGVVLKKTGQYTDEEIQLLRRAHELGLTGTGVFTGETQIWADQARKLFQGEAGQRVLAVSRGSAAARAGGEAWDLMRRSYIASDDVGKFGSWLNWRNYLVNKVVDAKSKRVTAEGQQYLVQAFGATERPRTIREVEEVAAEYVKSTFQHYPRTAPVAKSLARFPLAGTFVSFPLEMARNVGNIFRFAGKHFAYAAKNRNNEAAAIGAALMTSPILAAISWKGAKSLIESDEETNPEVEEAIREYTVAPWSQNSDIIISKADEPGKWEVQDLGYNNPYGDLVEVFNAAIMRPGTMEERMTRVAEKIEETVAGKELFLFSAIEALFNFQMEKGLLSSVLTGESGARKISRDTDFVNNISERAYHFLKGAGPGGLVAVDRIVNAATGLRGFGLAPKKYQWTEREVVDESLALLGVPRTVTIDPQKAFYFRFRDQMAGVEASTSSFKRAWRIAEGPLERQNVIDTYKEQWEDRQAELRKMIEGAKTLGLSNKRIVELLSTVPTARVRANVMRALIAGKDIPFEAVYRKPRPIPER